MNGRSVFWKRLLAFAGAYLVAFTAVTSAAFTDRLLADFGDNARVGGVFDIKVSVNGGDWTDANPVPLQVPQFGVITPIQGTGPEPVVNIKIKTTSKVTGRVWIQPEEGGGDIHPWDPFNFSLYTMSVDGVPVADHLTPTQLSRINIENWTTGVEKEIEIAVSLRSGISDPNMYGKFWRLALHIYGRNQ
jgi:hypothetical protein